MPNPFVLIAALLIGGAGVAQSAPPPGASACTSCHGSTGPLSLSGLTAEQIESALEGFRSGTIEATLMPRIAKGFTAEESRAIALWLANG